MVLLWRRWTRPELLQADCDAGRERAAGFAVFVAGDDLVQRAGGVLVQLAGEDAELVQGLALRGGQQGVAGLEPVQRAVEIEVQAGVGVGQALVERGHRRGEPVERPAQRFGQPGAADRARPPRPRPT